MPDLPKAARDSSPVHTEVKVDARAYIKNPIIGQEMLTPAEALRAVGILVATLECDEYRTTLAAREAPDGE